MTLFVDEAVTIILLTVRQVEYLAGFRNGVLGLVQELTSAYKFIIDKSSDYLKIELESKGHATSGMDP